MKKITMEEYKELKKMATFTFKRYFSFLVEYKEDLVQSGIVFLLCNYERYDEQLGKIENFQFNYIRYGMLQFVRKLNGNYNEKLCKDISLDMPVGLEEEETLQNFIPDNSMVEKIERDSINQVFLICVKRAINKICQPKELKIQSLLNARYNGQRVKGFNYRAYDILTNFCKTQNAEETAKKFGITREAVRHWKILLREQLRKELQKEDICI